MVIDVVVDDDGRDADADDDAAADDNNNNHHDYNNSAFTNICRTCSPVARGMYLLISDYWDIWCIV